MEACGSRTFNLKNRPFKVVVCTVTLVAFLFTIIPPDIAWALKADHTTPVNIKTASTNAITIPEALGYIKESWIGAKSKSTIIHIQDAHCNYYAQGKIAEIIKYLNDNYGVSTVNLEGGTKDYDLSLFTGIKDKVVREKTTDHFVKEGVLNGAEYFSANNPKKISLWGIEDTKLYIENLSIYRDSLTHKDDASRSLKNLNYILSNLKTKIYSKELLELDRKANAYMEKSTELKDYITYLINLAKSKDINLSDFKNIGILSRTTSLEPGIDFKKANTERDELVDRLTKLLSRVEVKELVEKAVEFKLGRLMPSEFYSYIIAKSKELRINLDVYKNLTLYIEYTQLYSTIKNDQLFKELDILEGRVTEKLYQDPAQIKLNKLSKNLSIIKNILGITLTPDEYKYYTGHRDEFRMENYVKFVDIQAPLHGFNLKLDSDILKLDEYLEKIEKFYTVSLKRDGAFLKNLKFNSKTAILITGGFHSKNLAELFKKNNISYISIIPNFRSEDGYECPYFKLLSGQKNITLAKEVQKLTGQALAYCSPNTELAVKVAAELPTGRIEELSSVIAPSVIGTADAVPRIVKMTEDYAKENSEELLSLQHLITFSTPWAEEQLIEETWKAGTFGYDSGRVLYGKWKHSFCAVDNAGKPIGMLLACERNGGEIEGVDKTSLYVMTVAVRPDYQRRGIATKLLAQAALDLNNNGFTVLEKDYDGPPLISIQTSVDETDTQRVYERIGFKKVGTKQYPNHLDYVYCTDAQTVLDNHSRLKERLAKIEYKDTIIDESDFDLSTAGLTLTKYCDRKCPFCSVSTLLLKQGQVIDPSNVVSQNVLDRFLKVYSKPRRLLLNLFGLFEHYQYATQNVNIMISGDGEPFLEFEKLLHVVKSVECAMLTIKTNGFWGKTEGGAALYFKRLTEAANSNPGLGIIQLNVSSDAYHRNISETVNIVDRYLTFKDNNDTENISEKIRLVFTCHPGPKFEEYQIELDNALRGKDIHLVADGVRKGPEKAIFLKFARNENAAFWLLEPSLPIGESYHMWDQMRTAWQELYDFTSNLRKDMGIKLPIYGELTRRDPYVSLKEYAPTGLPFTILGCRYNGEIEIGCSMSPFFVIGDVNMTQEKLLTNANNNPFIRAIKEFRMKEILEWVSKTRPALTAKIPFGTTDIEVMSWLLSQDDVLAEGILDFILQKDYRDGRISGAATPKADSILKTLVKPININKVLMIPPVFIAYILADALTAYAGVERVQPINTMFETTAFYNSTTFILAIAVMIMSIHLVRHVSIHTAGALNRIGEFWGAQSNNDENPYRSPMDTIDIIKAPEASDYIFEARDRILTAIRELEKSTKFNIDSSIRVRFILMSYSLSELGRLSVGSDSLSAKALGLIADITGDIGAVRSDIIKANVRARGESFIRQLDAAQSGLNTLLRYNRKVMLKELVLFAVIFALVFSALNIDAIITLFQDMNHKATVGVLGNFLGGIPFVIKKAAKSSGGDVAGTASEGAKAETSSVVLADGYEGSVQKILMMLSELGIAVTTEKNREELSQIVYGSALADEPVTFHMPYGGYVVISTDKINPESRHLGKIEHKKIYATVVLNKAELKPGTYVHEVVFDTTSVININAPFYTGMLRMAFDKFEGLSAKRIIKSPQWPGIEAELKKRVGEKNTALIKKYLFYICIISKNDKPLPWQICGIDGRRIYITDTGDYQKMAEALMTGVGRRLKGKEFELFSQEGSCREELIRVLRRDQTLSRRTFAAFLVSTPVVWAVLYYFNRWIRGKGEAASEKFMPWIPRQRTKGEIADEKLTAYARNEAKLCAEVEVYGNKVAILGESPQALKEINAVERLKYYMNILPKAHVAGIRRILIVPENRQEELMYSDTLKGTASGLFLGNHSDYIDVVLGGESQHIGAYRVKKELYNVPYHEIGHYVYHKVLSEKQRSTWDSFYNKNGEVSTDFVSTYAGRSAGEDFAETYSAYCTDSIGEIGKCKAGRLADKLLFISRLFTESDNAGNNFITHYHPYAFEGRESAAVGGVSTYEVTPIRQRIARPADLMTIPYLMGEIGKLWWIYKDYSRYMSCFVTTDASETKKLFKEKRWPSAFDTERMFYGKLRSPYELNKMPPVLDVILDHIKQSGFVPYDWPKYCDKYPNEHTRNVQNTIKYINKFKDILARANKLTAKYPGVEFKFAPNVVDRIPGIEGVFDSLDAALIECDTDGRQLAVSLICDDIMEYRRGKDGKVDFKIEPLFYRALRIDINSHEYHLKMKDLDKTKPGTEEFKAYFKGIIREAIDKSKNNKSAKSASPPVAGETALTATLSSAVIPAAMPSGAGEAEIIQLFSLLSENQRMYLNEDITSRRRERFLIAHKRFETSISSDMSDAVKKEKKLADTAFKLVDLQETIDELTRENEASGTTNFSVSDVADKMLSFRHIVTHKDRYTVLNRWMKTAGLSYEEFGITPGLRSISSVNIHAFHFAGKEFILPDAISGKVKAIGSTAKADTQQMRLVSVDNPACALTLVNKGTNIEFEFTNPNTGEKIADMAIKPNESIFNLRTTITFIKFMDSILGIPAEFVSAEAVSPRAAAIKNWLESNGHLISRADSKGSKSLDIGNTTLYLPNYYKNNMEAFLIYKDQQVNTGRICIVDKVNPDKNYIVFEVRRINGVDKVVCSHTGTVLNARQTRPGHYLFNLNEYDLFRKFDENLHKLGAPITLESTINTNQASHIVFGRTHFNFCHSKPLTYNQLMKAGGKRALRASVARDDFSKYPLTVTRPDGKTIEIRVCPDNKDQYTISGLTWKKTGKPVLLTKIKGHTSFNLSVIAELIRRTPAGNLIAADETFLDTFEFMINEIQTGSPMVNTYHVDPEKGTLTVSWKVRANELTTRGIDIAPEQAHPAEAPQVPPADAIGKFIEIKPIRVNDHRNLEGLIENIDTGERLDLTTIKVFESSQVSYGPDFLKNVERLISDTVMKAEERDLLESIIQKFKKAPPEYIFVQYDKLRAGFFGVGKPDLIVTSDKYLSLPTFFLHEVIEHLKYKDLRLIHNIMMLLDKDSISWFLRHKEKYDRLGKGKYFDENKDHYIIRAFIRQVFKEMDRKVSISIKLDDKWAKSITKYLSAKDMAAFQSKSSPAQSEFAEKYRSMATNSDKVNFLLRHYPMPDVIIDVEAVETGPFTPKGTGRADKIADKHYKITLFGVDGSHEECILFHEFMHIWLEEKGLTFRWTTKDENTANYLFYIRNMINDYIIEKENRKRFGNYYVNVTKDLRDTDLANQFNYMIGRRNTGDIDIFMLAITCKAVARLYPELSDTISAKVVGEVLQGDVFEKVLSAMEEIYLDKSVEDYRAGISKVHLLLTEEEPAFKGNSIIVNEGLVGEFTNIVNELMGQIAQMMKARGSMPSAHGNGLPPMGGMAAIDNVARWIEAANRGDADGREALQYLIAQVKADMPERRPDVIEDISSRLTNADMRAEFLSVVIAAEAVERIRDKVKATSVFIPTKVRIFHQTTAGNQFDASEFGNPISFSSPEQIAAEPIENYLREAMSGKTIETHKIVLRDHIRGRYLIEIYLMIPASEYCGKISNKPMRQISIACDKTEGMVQAASPSDISPEVPRLDDKTKAKEIDPEDIKWKHIGSESGYENLDEARRSLLSSEEPYCFTVIKEPAVASLEALVKSGNLELGIIRVDISQSPGKMHFVWYLVKGEPERFVHPIGAPMDFRLHIHSKRRTREINMHRDTYMYPGQTDQRLAFQAGRIEYVLSNKGICAYGKFIDKPILMSWDELRLVDRRLSRFNQYVLSGHRRAVLSAQNIPQAVSNAPEFPRLNEPAENDLWSESSHNRVIGDIDAIKYHVIKKLINNASNGLTGVSPVGLGSSDRDTLGRVATFILNPRFHKKTRWRKTSEFESRYAGQLDFDFDSFCVEEFLEIEAYPQPLKVPKYAESQLGIDASQEHPIIDITKLNKIWTSSIIDCMFNVVLERFYEGQFEKVLNNSTEDKLAQNIVFLIPLKRVESKRADRWEGLAVGGEYDLRSPVTLSDVSHIFVPEHLCAIAREAGSADFKSKIYPVGSSQEDVNGLGRVNAPDYRTSLQKIINDDPETIYLIHVMRLPTVADVINNDGYKEFLKDDDDIKEKTGNFNPAVAALLLKGLNEDELAKYLIGLVRSGSYLGNIYVKYLINMDHPFVKKFIEEMLAEGLSDMHSPGWYTVIGALALKGDTRAIPPIVHYLEANYDNMGQLAGALAARSGTKVGQDFRNALIGLCSTSDEIGRENIIITALEAGVHEAIPALVKHLQDTEYKMCFSDIEKTADALYEIGSPQARSVLNGILRVKAEEWLMEQPDLLHKMRCLQAFKNSEASEVSKKLSDKDPEEVKEMFGYVTGIYSTFKRLLESTRQPEEPRYIFMPVPGTLSDMKDFAKKILRANGFTSVNIIFYDGTINGLRQVLSETSNEKVPVNPRNALAYIDKKELKGLKKEHRENLGVTFVKENVPEDGGQFSVGGHAVLALGVLDLISSDRAEDSDYWRLVLELVRRISNNKNKYEGITKKEFMQKIYMEDLEIDLPPIGRERIDENMRKLSIVEKAVGTAM